VPEAADGLEAGAGFDAGAGMEAGAGFDAGAELDAGAVLEAVAGSGAAVLDVVAVLEPVAGSGAAVLDAVAVLDVVAVLEPVAGSGAGAEVDASAESEAEAVSSAGAGSDVGGGSEAGCRSEAGCGSEAGGGAGSEAGGGPDAAPTRGIASKRFENFIPCLVPAPRSSCFSLFVAGERRSPVCCQEPSMRARRCMSVCTALVTPRTGPLTVVLPCPEESMPTSACAAALLESAWATAIAAQELPINRQAATMQTPAAKRKRAATTITPPTKTATSQTFATLLHIPAEIGPARLSTRATVAGKSPFTTRRLNLTRSGSTTAFLRTSPISRGLATWSNALPVHWAARHPGEQQNQAVTASS